MAQLHPTANEPRLDSALADAVDAAVGHRWSIRWGVLVEADVFGLPEWAVPLRGPALYDAGLQQLRWVQSTYGHRLEGIDLVRPALKDEGLNDERIGPAMVRGWAAWARGGFASDATANGGVHVNQGPDHVRLNLRFDQALEGSDTPRVMAAMDRTVRERWPVDGFTVSQRYGPRPLRQENLEPAIRRLAKFGRPLVVTNLEVNGSNPIEAAANLETVLRTLFAEPMVQGIYLAGLRERDVVDPSGALLDDQDRVTSMGRVVDRLFREQWWSEVTVTTDALGRASARVFRGDYQLTVRLPSGEVVSLPLRVTEDRTGERELIVMPMATD